MDQEKQNLTGTLKNRQGIKPHSTEFQTLTKNKYSKSKRKKTL